MGQFLEEYLHSKLEEGGQAIADEIISIVIAWYRDHGVAMEVRCKGTFKEDN